MSGENLNNGPNGRHPEAPPNASDAPAVLHQARTLRIVKLVLSAFALVLGLVTIVVTIAAGGGATARGILLGAILALMGLLRLYLTLKHDV